MFSKTNIILYDNILVCVISNDVFNINKINFKIMFYELLNILNFDFFT